MGRGRCEWIRARRSSSSTSGIADDAVGHNLRPMRVREFASTDREEVVDLWRDVFGYSEPRNRPERVLDELAKGHAQLFVAVDDAGVAGTLLAGFDGHRGWLYRAAVAPRARRRGAGRALVVAAEAALRSRGCVK